MEKMNDLRDLLKHEIEDLYSAEEQIIEALPLMIDKAENPNLKNALSGHLKITKKQKERLDKVQKLMGEGGQEEKKGIFGKLFGGGKHHCKGMAGIIEEGNKIMNADISPEARDAAIIASAQKVEHYEICGYGTAKSFAEELGLQEVAKQLEQTLQEEYDADLLMTQLAEERVNKEAETPSEGGASGASRGRTSGRVKEKAGREMEMEPVSSSRGRSSGSSSAGNSGKNSGNNGGGRKPSGSSRSESGGRGTGNSSKKTASGGRSSGNSGRSSSGGRGNSSSSRGRR